MRLGIFAKTFSRPSVEAVFEAVRAHGLEAVQFNFSVAGLASMPDTVPDGLVARIRAAAGEVEISATSGTFNMAHPDPQVRADGLRRLEVIAEAMGGVITLCTGSRDSDDMWRRHPDNDTPQAWADMRETMFAAVAIAERHDAVLAIEPEVSNVVSSPAAARTLLDELQTPRLKIVIDAANLAETSRASLTEAFELLSADIVLAHAKDITAEGAFAAAGQGDVDWEHYLTLLADSGYGGALVMHGLDEADVPASTAFLTDRLRATA